MPQSISVTIDKSHLVTIGEKLYSQRIDFIRELVNNAYDADATMVAITVTNNRISVEDNGSGMAKKDLEQYFTIGSMEKQSHPTSPKFKRRRIGEFGIGKFAALAAANEFELETQKDDFSARIVFSKKEWFSKSHWQIPLEKIPPSPFRLSGTTVVLKGLKQPFSTTEITRIIREKCPVSAKSFTVMLNGVKIEKTDIPGRVIPIQEKTPFGPIQGKIILANQNARDKAGIHVLVRGVSIRPEFFGAESHAYGSNRLCGFVEADFLPITSGRDDFIRDTEEFRQFYKIMQKHVRKALNVFKDLQWQKMNKKASEALKEALKKIGNVLKKYPEFMNNNADIPFGDEQIADDFFQQKASEEGYAVSKPKIVDSDTQDDLMPNMLLGDSTSLPQNNDNNDSDLEKEKQLSLEKPEKQKRSVTAQKTIIRRLRLANMGLICRMEHLGDQERESYSDFGSIFINLDHPYYRKIEKNENLLIFHLCRLIALEIAIKKEENLQDALRLQDDILRKIL